MPSFWWSFGETSEDVTHLDDRSAVFSGILTCRLLDSDQVTWSRIGRFYPSVAVLPTKRIYALSELYGLKENVAEPEEDEHFEYQLSNNGGSTWQWWNGTAWAAAALDTHRNTMAVLDAHLQTFAPGSREFTLKVFLIPSTSMMYRPALGNVILYGETVYNFDEDIIRSMRAYLEANLRPARRALFDVAGEEFVLFPKLPSLTTPIRAYNLADDPYRATNIFQAVTNVSEDGQDYQQVSFTDYQSGQVEVQYVFLPEFHVALSDAELIEAKLPSVVLQFFDSVEAQVEFSGSKVYDVAEARRLARIRPAPTTIEKRVQMRLQGDMKQDCEAMVEAVRVLFDREALTFPSLADGQFFEVTMGPIGNNDMASQELKVRVVSATIAGKRWSRAYEEVHLTEEIRLRAGTFTGADAEVVVNV